MTNSDLEQQVKELQEENRQLKFRLADEQDCNQHGECHQIIQDLKEQRDFLQNDLVDKKQKLENIEEILHKFPPNFDEQIRKELDSK